MSLLATTDAPGPAGTETGGVTAHRLGPPWHGPSGLRAPTLPAGAPARLRGFAREVVVVAGAMVAYFGVRNLTAGGAATAIANARLLERFERWAGIAWEHGLQSLVVGSNTLTTVANWVYIWGHWPVILGSAVALYALRRPRYRLLRDAIVLSGVVGFAFFALFPVAPPRLVDPALLDTVTLHSHAYRALQPPGLTNQFAAFPSLHVGWNLLVGMALYEAFRSRLVRVFAAAMPLAMAFAVVVTANHYVVDVVVGVMVVLAAHLLVRTAARRGPGTLVSDAWRD